MLVSLTLPWGCHFHSTSALELGVHGLEQAPPPLSPDRGQACGLLSAAHLPSHSHRNLRPHFLTKGTGQSSKHLLAYVPPSIATPGTFLWGAHMTHGLYGPPGKDSGSIAYGVTFSCQRLQGLPLAPHPSLLVVASTQRLINVEGKDLASQPDA